MACVGKNGPDDEDSIQVLSTSNWSPVYSRSDAHLPWTVAWAPDGHTIASGGVAVDKDYIDIWMTMA